MFKVPEKYRRTRGRLGSTAELGNNGCFEIPSNIGGRWLLCIASDGLGWEHVSIHAEKGGGTFTPLWDETCQIKDLFWEGEDLVIQYHPKKSEYVSCHPNTLHLWRSVDIEIPRPDSRLVGGGTPNMEK